MKMPVPGICVVALLGHQERVGYTEEVEFCGAKFLAVEVPAVEGDDTHEPLGAKVFLVPPQAIYGVTDATEEQAIAARMRQRPWKSPTNLKQISTEDPPDAFPPYGSDIVARCGDPEDLEDKGVFDEDGNLTF